MCLFCQSFCYVYIYDAHRVPPEVTSQGVRYAHLLADEVHRHLLGVGHIPLVGEQERARHIREE